MSVELSIVVPVYNEGGNVRTLLNGLAAYAPAGTEILLVYDMEEDTTLPPARETAGQLAVPVRLVRNSLGRGVLNALKTGFAESQGTFVLVTMADLSDPPELIPDMLRLAQESDAAIVCASRFMKGGSHTGGPFLKNLLSRLACLSLHYVARVPTHDATNNFKLYRRSFLQSVTIESTGGFEIALELTVKAFRQRRTILQLPSSWTERNAGQSHFKLWKWLPKYLKWYFKALMP